MKILAIDPGVTSGFAYGSITDAGLLNIYPVQMVDDVDDLYRRLKSYDPRHIVIEDFEFRQKARAGLNLFPMQLIGVTRLWALAGAANCQAHLQKAATGKSYYTNNVLKGMGVYQPGAAHAHAMDAMRHLLQWFTFGAGYQFNKSKSRDFARLITIIPGE